MLFQKSFSKTKTYFIDRYHLLFRGAAENHLRIQNALKNPDGTYQVTLKFDSYTDLKKYQKKLRRVTVSLSGAVAMAIVAFVVAPYVMNPNRSSAATFQWVQNKWTTVSTDPTAHPTDTATFGKYVSKNVGITINASNQPTLTTPVPETVRDTNFSGIAQAGTYANAGNGNALTLQSLLNGSCTQTSNCKNSTNQQCTNGFCKLNDGQNCSVNADCVCNYCAGTPATCVRPCSADSICGQYCAYGGDVYATVQIETQCWFKQNLNVGTYLASGPYSQTNNSVIEKFCYDNNTANCTAEGGIYQWNEAMGYVTTDGAQGICPAGWHIPTDAQFQTLEMQLGMTQVQANATGWRGTNQGTQMKVGGSSGLNMPLAGYTYTDGSFRSRTTEGVYWLSSMVGIDYALMRSIGPYNETVYRQFFPRTYGLSVRCIKN